jgi:hypothetical protein
LQGCQLRNESDAIAAFYHAHKCFQASQTVSGLTQFYLFHLAETHQLVAETVTFIQQPEMFVAYISRTDHIFLEYRIVFSHISEELLII